MSSRSFLNDDLYEYLLRATLKPDPLMDRLRAETEEATGRWAGMQISADQGRLMQLLAELIGARRYLEVGTFTGTSALYVARALPEDGEVVACDVSEEWTDIGKLYWQEAGVAGKVNLVLAPALETMARLIGESEGESFDMIFLDGDKSEYDDYYEFALQLLRQGGLVLVDNVLWVGRVADPEINDDDTVAIRALNAKIRDDDRVSSVLISIGDGLTVARKL